MFHGISINKEEIILDGSEAPVRIDAEALLSSEKLSPAANLNKVKYSFCFLDDEGWNCSFCFHLNKYQLFFCCGGLLFNAAFPHVHLTDKSSIPTH